MKEELYDKDGNRVYFSDSGLRAEVELPTDNGNRINDSLDLFARRYTPRHWWKFWKPDHEDLPIRVTKFL